MSQQAEFRAKLYQAARAVPAGRVVTYGQLAALAGKPRNARAAGMYMRLCEEPGVPCHRVVFHDGSLCRGDAFGGMPSVQRELLRSEGVAFLKDGRVDLAACRYMGPESIF